MIKFIELKKEKLRAKATLFFFCYFLPAMAFASGSNMFTSVLNGAVELFTNYIVRIIIVIDVIWACIMFNQGRMSKAVALTHIIGGAALLSTSFIASMIFKV